MKKINTLFNKSPDLEAKLMVSFDEELNDPNFKELVNQIHLPYEIQAKYTSILKTSVREYNHCKQCKGLAMCQNEITGCAYLPKVEKNRLIFCYKTCRFQEELEKRNAYQKNISIFELPKEIREADVSKIDKTDKKRFEVIKWLFTFIKDYPNVNKGLFLHGSFGSGKTYLIAAVFNELAKKGVKGAIVFWPEYLTNLKRSFGSDYHDQIRQIKKIPLLLIDDIGAETATPWARDEILCPILQYRMQEHLPTFFTSNLDLNALEKHFSITKDGVEQVKAGRLMERVKQLTENLELISKNLRK